jgi:acyl-CoA reductase-like NAD-dependent aldehyde dehydrogenase
MPDIPTYSCSIAGQPVDTGATTDVIDKWTGDVFARVARAGADELERAIASAHAAERDAARLPAHTRAAVCRHVARRLGERREEFARALVREVGKPIGDSRGEVARAIDTFTIASEEATRIRGEHLPLDVTGRAPAGCQGIVKRVPVGTCALITPFNFPLNLAAHKVAPAIAAGCPFVLKPSEKTPLTSLMLAELIAETDWPREAWSVVTCDSDAAAPLVEDDRLKLLSFTGSATVGWALKAKAGKKKVILELGGDAGCIIDETAELDHAVERVAFGGFYQSGQSCISVQRVLVHRTHEIDFSERLAGALHHLIGGDPFDDQTFLAPLIDEAAAERVERWVDEAIRDGAHLLCGGTRDGSHYAPTVLTDVPDRCTIAREEVFGPVVLLESFDDFDAALERVNASRFGIQAGVFTNDMRHAMRAWNELAVGAVVINDVPSFRIDAMPYGGVKDSGLHREGPRHAIEDMTEPRLLVLT